MVQLKIIKIDFYDIWQRHSIYSRIEFVCFSFHVGLLIYQLFCKIDPYNFELYHFKFGALFLRHSVDISTTIIDIHNTLWVVVRIGRESRKKCIYLKSCFSQVPVTMMPTVCFGRMCNLFILFYCYFFYGSLWSDLGTTVFRGKFFQITRASLPNSAAHRSEFSTYSN